MWKVVSEGVHVGGLVIQLVQMRQDSFSILTQNDNTGLWWPTVEGGTTAQAKQYVEICGRRSPQC
jgi:hypothetical protein